MQRMIPLAVALILSSVASAGEVVDRIDQRFAKNNAAEVPDFQKHVVPLMGKLGCNGRSCHGSFQGQGGFRLSLFGYDFKMDHEGLTEGDEPRIDLKSPADSLAILKPTMEIPHEGGKRYELGSWQHRVFLNWVKDGAKPAGEEKHALQKLELTPSEIIFKKKGDTVQLKAVAVWSDGTREDVTTLTRFQTNSSQVATVTDDGLLTAAEAGDTHVVAFYDVAVVPVPVIRPVSDLAGDRYPEVATSTKVDKLVVQKLSKLGIVPSDRCSDSEFLRRVSLDLTGTLPSHEEAAAFLKDTSPDKRSKKIDELLETPGYTAWWTTRLCDLTGNNDRELNNVFPVNNRGMATQFWYDWIHERVERNEPYDKLMAGIILGKSREPSEDFDKFCTSMTDITLGEDSKKEFHDRSTMPLYWARNSLRRSNETRAISFAYTFMGIRIQCAQCHKHPFDQWTQDDFKEFSSFFAGVNFTRNPESSSQYTQMLKDLGVDKLRGGDQRRKLQSLAREGKVVPFQEVFVNRPAKAKDSKGRPVRSRGNRTPPSAKLLGGDEIDLTQFEDPREPLVEWLRGRDNRFFARAFANRVWSNYFNIGIVEPADDMSLANPPSNAALLDYLATQFVDHDFDMKWLHREILNSDTYQRSWKPTESNRLDLVNFSHSIPRRLPAEVAYDSIAFATASDKRVSQLKGEVSKRAIGIPAASRSTNGPGYALQIFGRSLRESNCDCDRSSESSLLQTVYLQNDRDVLAMLTQKDTWIGELAASVGQSAAQSRADQLKRKRIMDSYRKQEATIKQRLKKARADENSRQIKQLEGVQKNLAARLKATLKKSGLKPEPEKPVEVAKLDVEPLVRQAYLRTLSRYPSDQELSRSLEYVNSTDKPVDGLKDLMWALINTKEFIVNH